MNDSASASPLVVALDIGTSSTRAIAFDTGGHKVGDEVQKHYAQTTTPDGGVEIGAEALLDLTAQCLDELLSQLHQPIIAVGASCFWHSLMAIGKDDKPLTGVLSWADNRAAAWVPPLRALLDEQETHARTGCVFHTSYWPAKLLWLHDTQPHLFGDDTRWMSFGEFLALRWCGENHCSLSMASGTGLFNQNNAHWDEQTLDVLPISPKNLSPLCDAHDALPPLSDEWVKRWPALKDAKWFPALGDGACSNVGSGCVSPSRIALNVGTSGALRVVLDDCQTPAPEGLWRYRLDKKRSLMGGALSNGGNVLRWALDTFKLPEDWEAQMAALEPDAHGLTVLPFLAGERSPLWNANARLAISGGMLDTTPLELLRACLEGAALRFAEVAEVLTEAIEDEPEHPLPQGASVEIVFSGGALEVSPGWAQILCDCLGSPLIESHEKEASARGAALMALEACGIIKDIADAPAERGRTLQPDKEHHARYRRALERQNTIYQQLFGRGHS